VLVLLFELAAAVGDETSLPILDGLDGRPFGGRLNVDYLRVACSLELRDELLLHELLGWR
jgi:hypothetical protein